MYKNGLKNGICHAIKYKKSVPGQKIRKEVKKND